MTSTEQEAPPEPKGGTYKLKDPDTGAVVRVGRTNDFSRRFCELNSSLQQSGVKGAKVMKEETFWTLIERARRSTAQPLAQSLQLNLEQLEPKDIVAFHNRLWCLMAQAHTDALWAVSYIVNGGSSSDGFCYFRAWLIAQGQEKYMAALADSVQAAVGLEPGDIAENEEVLGSAVDAYYARTGRELWDKAAPISSVEQRQPDWSEDQLSTLYPELDRRFLGNAAITS